jgi:hypothetical protein
MKKQEQPKKMGNPQENIQETTTTMRECHAQEKQNDLHLLQTSRRNMQEMVT